VAQGDVVREIAGLRARDEPCWRIQSSLNIFERYLLPLSQAKVTTRFGVVCAWQYFSAAASSVPLEEPARMPSVFSSSRAVVNASRSVMRQARFTPSMWASGGIKSSPIPQPARSPRRGSVRFRPDRPERIRRVGEDKLRVRRVFGKPRLQAAQRTAGADAHHDGVDPPSSCSYSSGAVVVRCASGLASLLNWSM
jgi:hypothetical protein